MIKDILYKIFSVTNEYTADTKHKVFNICGIKIKFKQKFTPQPIRKKVAAPTAQHQMHHNAVKYTISILKKYGIRHIVSAPGACNAYFNLLIQDDSFFKCYSVIDERAAVYTATGIAYETNEPVVVACTGATAARNFMSGMTEAYYRNIPIIALTFFDYNNNKFNMRPQYTDRSVHQNDIREMSVTLPKISDNDDKSHCLTYLNAALSCAVYKKRPVHINCPASFNFQEAAKDKTLPEDIWITKYYRPDELEELKNEFSGKKVAVFIGSHNKFEESETKALSSFAEAMNIPVFCDHTSNWHGKNKVLITQAVRVLSEENKPDLIIDIGNVSGNYSAPFLYRKAKVWRISSNGEFKCRFSKPALKTIDCLEKFFFEEMKSASKPEINYYELVKSKINKNPIPSNIPLSTTLVSQTLASMIPADSSLHVAILKSLQTMNYFNLPESVDVVCNVGGFGIDGPVSTAVGQSLYDRTKKTFAVTGDLAFFYDMNILGNRHISNNLRIILVNNNKGIEFRCNNNIERFFGEKTNILVAAAEHNKGGAEGWAKSCGFKYLKIETKEELFKNMKDFVKDCDSPILMEVFTTDDDEKNALNAMKI